MLYFLLNCYEPNKAHTNRLLGYFTALDRKGIEAKVYFLFPDSGGSRISHNYKYIQVHYMWSRWMIKSTPMRFLRYHLNLMRFLLVPKKNDVVYTYGINKTAKFLVSKGSFRVFAEITEHPSIIDGGKVTAIDENQKYKVATKLDKLFVISTALKNLFISKGVKASTVEIVNMIVDSSRFNVNSTNSGEKYIAYCGNASNNKDGVDKLIKAFKIVSISHPNVKLYIIGKAPSKRIDGGNLQLAKELGLMDKIVFTGLVPAEEIPQMLKDAEVLVLNRPDSVQAKYGFPTKLGEYLLTGNPVVVTKVGDIPKFLKDGESALLASPFDDQEFASKICWLLDNPYSAVEIGKKGKDVALRYFDSLVESTKIIANL